MDEFPALLLVKDSKQEVVENTVLDVWQLSADESLCQEELDQGGLVVWVPQSSQALEDAGDAQVVVAAAVDDKKEEYGHRCLW